MILALVSLLAWGCKSKECEQNLNCASSEVCMEGQCVARTCMDSSTCPMEHFCNADSGTCTAGCEYDRDCYPYHRCDTSGQCVENGCRDTELDCALGQYCNTLTGECYDAGGAYCHTCKVDSDCGGTNYCLDIGSPDGSRYCLVDCSLGQECPRGYSCVSIIDSGQNVVGEGCYARCWEL